MELLKKHMIQKKYVYYINFVFVKFNPYNVFEIEIPEMLIKNQKK